MDGHIDEIKMDEHEPPPPSPNTPTLFEPRSRPKKTPVFRVSDQVRLKPVCSATKT